MKTPTVSVVIASYNHEEYVKETIESVLNQTFQDFEIIITDEGSSDETVEIIKQFSDSRIKFFEFKDNKREFGALDNSIINSKGHYIISLDLKEPWELNKLETQIKFMDENPEINAVFKNLKNIALKEEKFKPTTIFELQDNNLIKSKENQPLFNGNKNFNHNLDLEVEVTELISQIDQINTEIYELRYLTNINRSIRQRLVSIFPSIYILLNRRNNGLKNALTNIKGYKSIKENQLFDIGYYLKNYQDVRLSGADPIMHYIYYGAAEGRNPSPNFDSDSYLKSNSDVKRLNLNPLVHYALYGINEARYAGNLYARTRLSSKKRKILEEKYGVTVIMPTYNRADIIERAIDSVLNQTFTNYELIIIDDGSKDRTEELITTKYATQLNSGKIKYIKQKNSGVSSARNKGLS